MEHYASTAQTISALEHPAIPGLVYLSDYISPDEEACLLQQIDQQPWNADLRRRVQHYGYRYVYTARTITNAMCAAPFPAWLQDLARRVHQDNLIPTLPDQVIVNEYLPGQGIADHVDCVPCFGKVILSLSLGAGCDMRFTEKHSGMRLSLWLAPRSLLLLQGEARYNWQHGIPARRADRCHGKRVPRQRRVSLTFRTVRLQSS